MKKMTRMILISAIFVTSGLTAKVAHENYKAVISNDERIQKAYELAKKPNKAAVLEAIVDAANAESGERIQNAVIIDPEEPKVVRVKAKVTTSAGVSPIASVMDKKTVNKAEEFIEKVAHPAEAVMEDILEFSPDNIPEVTTQDPVLTYDAKDIFPEFEELTYKIKLPDIASWNNRLYIFDVNGDRTADGNVLNGILIDDQFIYIRAFTVEYNRFNFGKGNQYWDYINKNNTNVIKYDPNTKTVDYSDLVEFKDSDDKIKGDKTNLTSVPTCKEVYTFLTGVEKGRWKFLKDITG